MERDISKAIKSGSKAVTMHQWILATLRALNEQDPTQIGLSEKHFKVLNSQISVDPNSKKTPYQAIVSRF